MNKTFCVSCGYKNIYEATKPKFCAKCGDPVDGVSAAASSNFSSDESDDEVSVDLGSIDLQRLRRGISVDLPQPEKIENVMGTAEANERPMNRRPSQLPDGPAIWKQNQADVAPSKAPKDVE